MRPRPMVKVPLIAAGVSSAKVASFYWELISPKNCLFEHAFNFWQRDVLLHFYRDGLTVTAQNSHTNACSINWNRNFCLQNFIGFQRSLSTPHDFDPFQILNLSGGNKLYARQWPKFSRGTSQERRIVVIFFSVLGPTVRWSFFEWHSLHNRTAPPTPAYFWHRRLKLLDRSWLRPSTSSARIIPEAPLTLNSRYSFHRQRWSHLFARRPWSPAYLRGLR